MSAGYYYGPGQDPPPAEAGTGSASGTQPPTFNGNTYGTSVVQPLPQTQVFDFRPQLEKWKDDPSFKLDWHTKQLDADRLANEQAQKLAHDRDSLPLILDYQKQVEEHNKFVETRLAEFNKTLGMPAPQPMTPHATLPEALAGAVSMLAGNRADVSAVGTQQQAVADEARRYGGALATDQAQREAAGRGASFAQQQLSQGQGEVSRLTGMAVDQQNLQESRHIQQAQFNIQEADRKAAEARLDGKQEEANKFAYGGLLWKQYEALATHARDWDAVSTDQDKKSYDVQVDAIRRMATEKGLPDQFPYLPQGHTEKAQMDARKATLEDAKLKLGAEKLKLAVHVADQNFQFKGKSLAFKDKQLAASEAHWKGQLKIAQEVADNTKNYHAAMIVARNATMKHAVDVQNAADKAEAKRAATASYLATLPADAYERRKKVQQQLDGETSTAAGLAAYSKELHAKAFQTDADAVGVGKAYSDASGNAGPWDDRFVAHMNAFQDQIKAHPEKAEAIRALFKQTHGVDLPDPEG